MKEDQPLFPWFDFSIFALSPSDFQPIFCEDRQQLDFRDWPPTLILELNEEAGWETGVDLGDGGACTFPDFFLDEAILSPTEKDGKDLNEDYHRGNGEKRYFEKTFYFRHIFLFFALSSHKRRVDLNPLLAFKNRDFLGQRQQIAGFFHPGELGPIFSVG